MKYATNNSTSITTVTGDDMYNGAQKEVPHYNMARPEKKRPANCFFLSLDQHRELLSDVGYPAAFLFNYYMELANNKATFDSYRDEKIAEQLGMAPTTVRDNRCKLVRANWLRIIKNVDTKTRITSAYFFFGKQLVTSEEEGKSRALEAAQSSVSFSKQFSDAVDSLGLTKREQVMDRLEEVLEQVDHESKSALLIGIRSEDQRKSLVDNNWIKLQGTKKQRQNFKAWQAKNPESEFTLADYVEHGAVKLNRMIKEADKPAKDILASLDQDAVTDTDELPENENEQEQKSDDIPGSLVLVYKGKRVNEIPEEAAGVLKGMESMIPASLVQELMECTREKRPVPDFELQKPMFQVLKIEFMTPDMYRLLLKAQDYSKQVA